MVVKHDDGWWMVPVGDANALRHDPAVIEWMDANLGRALFRGHTPTEFIFSTKTVATKFAGWLEGAS